MLILSFVIYFITTAFLVTAGSFFILMLQKKIKQPNIGSQQNIESSHEVTLPVRFHLPALFFLFWSIWLLFFLFPWIFIYIHSELDKTLLTALIIISSFFIFAYLVTGLIQEKKQGQER